MRLLCGDLGLGVQTFSHQRGSLFDLGRVGDGHGSRERISRGVGTFWAHVEVEEQPSKSFIFNSICPKPQATSRAFGRLEEQAKKNESRRARRLARWILPEIVFSTTEVGR